MTNDKRWPVWKIVVVVIAAIIGGMVVINMLSMAFTGEYVFHGDDEPTEQVVETVDEAEPVDDAAHAEEEAPEGWRAEGSGNVTSLVKSIAVDDAGATIMFYPDSDTRNVTGRITEARLDGQTYPVGDPAVTYEQLTEDGEWASDNALWSIGMWDDEPYGGGIRVTVQGLPPEDYSGLTLVMDYDETDPSAWDGENKTISWTDQRLTLVEG